MTHCGANSVVTDQYQPSLSGEPEPIRPSDFRHPAGTLRALRDLALLASRITGHEVLAHAAWEVLRAALPDADSAIFVIDRSTEEWNNPVPPSNSQHAVLCHRAAHFLIHHAISVIIPDLQAPDSPIKPLTGEQGRALVALPCWSDRDLAGVVVAIDERPHAFTADDIAAVELVALHLGMGLHLSSLVGDHVSTVRQLDTLLHNTGDAVLITDESGCISEINPAARLMFKWTDDEFRCRPLHDLPFPPEMRSVIDAVMRRPIGSQMTFDARLEDGRVLAVSLASLDSQAQQGPTSSSMGRIMMIARDMTRLRDAERARLNFIHSAAHDMRNPLGVALVALSMLNKELQDTGSAMQHEIISIGLRGIERIERLINGLLHLEHIENEAGLNQTLVDVRDMIERAVIDTRPLFEARQQNFQLVLPDVLPALTGDAYWLTRALVQVLTNAAQYTPPGGSIELRVTLHSQALYLEVEDTGPGIPPESQAHVFDPFVYATHIDAAPDPDGVGLGLAIVKSVVERHQGRVFVSSTPHVGSIFGIILPVSAEQGI